MKENFEHITNKYMIGLPKNQSCNSGGSRNKAIFNQNKAYLIALEKKT